MSKVKIYEYMVGMQGTFVNMANGHRARPGQYVAHGDYLILLAKVKRLRIAGDEMANAIHPFDWDDEVRRWNEAKEGNPSV